MTAQLRIYRPDVDGVATSGGMLHAGLTLTAFHEFYLEFTQC